MKTYQKPLLEVVDMTPDHPIALNAIPSDVVLVDDSGNNE